MIIGLIFLLLILFIGFLQFQMLWNTPAMWDVKIKSLIESGGRRDYPGPPIKPARGGHRHGLQK